MRRGDHLTVHSRLLSFGCIEGGAEMVFRCLREAVGAQGTIVVPTYTLAAGTIYDRANTPSQGVGILCEYVRTLPGVVRSACPMHNHAGIGDLAPVLEMPDGTVSIGKGSDFDALHQAGFRLLLLGTGFSTGASFIHHVETIAAVPYRQWYDIPRQYVVPRGSIATMTCRYYGRPDDRIIENFDCIEGHLVNAGFTKVIAAPLGASRLVDLDTLSSVCLEMLQHDVYALVTRK